MFQFSISDLGYNSKQTVWPSNDVPAKIVRRPPHHSGRWTENNKFCWGEHKVITGQNNNF